MRRRHGFTLLELIIAIGLAAIIAATLYGALSIAFNAREIVREQMVAPQQAAIALETMRHDLESVVILDPTGIEATFIGTSQGTGDNVASTVEFYCLGKGPASALVDAFGDPLPLDPTLAAPDGEPHRDGLRWVRLSVQRDPEVAGGSMLTRQVDDNPFSPTPFEPPIQTLVTSVLGMEIRYFDGTSWSSEWDSTTWNGALPTAVEMTLTLDRAGPDGRSPYRVTQVMPIAVADPNAFLATPGEFSF